MPAAVRAAEHWAIAYRRTWRGSVFTTIVNPVLFLAALGLGFGSLVDDGSRRETLEGVSYLRFLAPGLLAATAMQTAATEASYPVMAGFKWIRSYDAMLATPLGARDVALGQLLWVLFRVVLSTAIFLAVVVAFGAAETVGIVGSLPAAVLTGAAFAAAVAAYTATVDSEYNLSSLLRFGILPMFLFSGTFFPIEQLPGFLRPIAYATPLWHGVELSRSLALGYATLGGAVLHVAYLLVWTAVGTSLTIRFFERRLVH